MRSSQTQRCCVCAVGGWKGDRRMQGEGSKHEGRKGVGITRRKDRVLLILQMNWELFFSHTELQNKRRKVKENIPEEKLIPIATAWNLKCIYMSCQPENALRRTLWKCLISDLPGFQAFSSFLTNDQSKVARCFNCLAQEAVLSRLGECSVILFSVRCSHFIVALPLIRPGYKNGWFTDSAPPPLYVTSTVDDQILINTRESTAWHLQNVFKYDCLMSLGNADLQEEAKEWCSQGCIAWDLYPQAISLGHKQTWKAASLSSAALCPLPFNPLQHPFFLIHCSLPSPFLLSLSFLSARWRGWALHKASLKHYRNEETASACGCI